LFSTTLNHSLALVNTHRAFPLICGLIAPFSYLAGNRLGACTFPEDFLLAYTFLALLWIAFMDAIVAINKSLKYTAALIEHESKDTQTCSHGVRWRMPTLFT